MTDTAFSSIALHPALQNNLDSLGYRVMTPIQAQSLPLILAGEDLIAQARTGSGKTAAFGLGALNKLDVKRFRVQVLILCPTRELADQVAGEMRRLARAVPNIKVLTLCGGIPIGPQIGSLEHGAHIVVGTPGRVDDHLRKGTLKLDSLHTLVLDEADRMLDMGFEEVLDRIVEHLPRRRQTLLFSATFPDHIQSLSQRIMQSPSRVTVDSSHDEESIAQTFYEIADESERPAALYLLLMHFQPVSCLVFCNTRQETEIVANQLRLEGISVRALHGDLEQRSRDETLLMFANQSVSVLVATDVAARGLDIASVGMVANYHLAREGDVHVHRIGRTGRSGRQGVACTLYSSREEYKFERLAKYLGQQLMIEPLPPESALTREPPRPAMVTLQLDGGRKQKVRPGDILGALTGENGIAGTLVGKINISDQCAYVAVSVDAARQALQKLQSGKLKGRNFRVRRLSP